jgi:hypothetical protein
MKKTSESVSRKMVSFRRPFCLGHIWCPVAGVYSVCVENEPARPSIGMGGAG